MGVGELVFVACFAALAWLHVVFFDRIQPWRLPVLGRLFVRQTGMRHRMSKVLATLFAVTVSVVFLVMLTAYFSDKRG